MTCPQTLNSVAAVFVVELDNYAYLLLLPPTIRNKTEGLPCREGPRTSAPCPLLRPAQLNLEARFCDTGRSIWG